MAGNKSYWEIVASCDLGSVTDTDYFKEVWLDDNAMYTCVWLKNNFTAVPTTIYKELL